MCPLVAELGQTSPIRTPCSQHAAGASKATQQDAAYQDWDLGLGLLHEHFNLDTEPGEPREFDFLFSLPEALNFVHGHVDIEHASSSISPLISEEKSDLVRDAVKMAIGRWRPDACSSVEDQERNLSATQGVNFVPETAGPGNIQLMPEGFPLVVRDRLLTMLVSASHSRDNLRITSAFPSCDALGLLCRAFLEWHVLQDDTWIHIPSFKISEVPIELVAAIVAAGATRSSNRAVQKFGLAIHDLLMVQIRNIVGFGAAQHIFSQSILSPSLTEFPVASVKFVDARLALSASLYTPDPDRSMERR